MSTDATFSRAVFPVLAGGQNSARATATARGHAAGYAEGLRLAALELGERRERLDADYAALVHGNQLATARQLEVLAAAARALDARTAPALAEARALLAAGAFELVEAITGRMLEDSAGSARAAVERALSLSDGDDVRAVRLHPTDLEALGAGYRAQAGVELLADRNLTPGDAVADCSDGYLDARISTSLGRARAVLQVDAGVSDRHRADHSLTESRR
ncbi:FliH/SctL family protein [Arthrobacter sp. H41]|uniref:FliH/SctL family protein n=1 Tax=Arthrobacter sp. H41 TaxID=1312978 RepID=UPI0004BB88BE|nr:FliH/SctL family protein [Arthrobacter sp. H41]